MFSVQIPPDLILLSVSLDLVREPLCNSFSVREIVAQIFLISPPTILKSYDLPQSKNLNTRLEVFKNLVY